jgi:xylan 1,4-beta-xylosidase
MAVIRNPVLRGFNPDPSILRAGDDYYIATSTFEWFPGVQIHHSRDLRHWRLAARPLVRKSRLSLKARPGYLRLKGRESLGSKHRQSLIARRQQAFRAEAETALEFEPETFQQMAGLVYYYNTNNFYYLHVSRDEEAGKSLRIMSRDRGLHADFDYFAYRENDSA